jgi:hypothetical protein
MRAGMKKKRAVKEAALEVNREASNRGRNRSAMSRTWTVPRLAWRS